MTSTLNLLRNACTAQARVDSPLGPMLLLRTSHGLAGAWFDGQKHHPGELDAPERRDDALLAQAASELRAYFAGDRERFDVPLDLQGTVFQRTVWQALLAIAKGRTRSYADVARELGNASALRAVGAAIGRNPISVIVPCHRIVGSDGSLTGYAGGVARKLALLELESARVGSLASA